MIFFAGALPVFAIEFLVVIVIPFPEADGLIPTAFYQTVSPLSLIFGKNWSQGDVQMKFRSICRHDGLRG